MATQTKTAPTAFENLQKEVTSKTREAWLTGLGILATVEEEGGKLFDSLAETGKSLISKGEAFEKRGKEFTSDTREDVSAKMNETVELVEQKVGDVMHNIGVNPKEDVKTLADKVDKLTATVEKLVKKMDK